MTVSDEVFDTGDGRNAIHEWFELTYAKYLTIPRSVLQSMPTHWQRSFVDLLNEMEVTCNKHGVSWPASEVRFRDEKGRMVRDDLADYERGRRKLWNNGDQA